MCTSLFLQTKASVQHDGTTLVSQYLSVGCVLVWEQSNFGNPSISVPPHSQADHASIYFWSLLLLLVFEDQSFVHDWLLSE